MWLGDVSHCTQQPAEHFRARTIIRRLCPEWILNPRRYTIGFLTVLLLVALRVVIGWHFFQEGLAHKNDPHWSSEGFLRQARGPLAEQFKQWVPEFHQWDRLIAVPMAPEPAAVPDEGNPEGAAKNSAMKSEAAEKMATTRPNEGNPEGSIKAAAAPRAAESPVYGKWYQQIVRDWSQRRQDIANYYRFTDEQNKTSEKVLAHYRDELISLLHGVETDIAAYRHELYRNGQMATQPGAEEIPNERERLAQREQNPLGEPGLSVGSAAADWRSDAEALEAAWQNDVMGLRSLDQVKLGPMPEVKTDLKKIDAAITWLLIVGGGLLMIGLFTRLSALALGLFLLAVIATQPPWIASPMPPYYQGVECVALLALATSPVGRWAGLDFFVHHVLLRPFRRA
jgi:uncharacterized membrane protein YphA (DoxX/SURF4 family)